jgi:gamma-glutamyltranspeptidase/glutathione hydrolase
MRLLDGVGVGEYGHNDPAASHLMAQVFRIAFADRYAYLADPAVVEFPLQQLLADNYLAERRQEIQTGPIRPMRAGGRERLGVRHGLASSMPDYAKGDSTTHLSMIDKDGVAVPLTQTLLGVWGSRVVVPGTGVLLNYGMMWFDPEPGRPNSVAGESGRSRTCPWRFSSAIGGRWRRSARAVDGGS